MAKSNMGKKEFVSTYSFPSQSIVEAETRGRKLEAGAEAEAVEKCYFLACASGLTRPAFLHIAARTTSPGSPPTVSWVLPNQPSVKKTPHSLAHRPIWWEHFSAEVPSFQMTLTCMELTLN